MKMHHIEYRFVIGPANILFASVCVCTFQPRTLTASGSEGIKYKKINDEIRFHNRNKTVERQIKSIRMEKVLTELVQFCMIISVLTALVQFCRKISVLTELVQLCRTSMKRL